MILHLLPLRCHGAEQRATGENQVLALIVVFLVDKEILLLRSDRRGDALRILSEQAQHAAGLTADCIHGAQQRGFLVKRLACVGAEGGRDVQRSVLDKRVGARVPCRITARLEGCAQAAGREGGGIRFALNQLLAAERHNNLAACGRRDKGIMLLRGDAGHGLEPVRVVGCTLFHRPVLHRVRHNVRNADIKRLAQLDGLHQLFEDLLRQLVAHDVFIKYVLREYFRNAVHI